MMDEVKNLPEDKASFLKELRRIFVYESTGIGEDRPEACQQFYSLIPTGSPNYPCGMKKPN